MPISPTQRRKMHANLKASSASSAVSSQSGGKVLPYERIRNAIDMARGHLEDFEYHLDLLEKRQSKKTSLLRKLGWDMYFARLDVNSVLHKVEKAEASDKARRDAEDAAGRSAV